jgi:hypothetical protein
VVFSSTGAACHLTERVVQLIKPGIPALLLMAHCTYLGKSFASMTRSLLLKLQGMGGCRVHVVTLLISSRSKLCSTVSMRTFVSLSHYVIAFFSGDGLWL